MTRPFVLTVPEFAAVTGIPDRTVRFQLKKGTIRGTQFDRHSPWRIPATEVDRITCLMWIEPNWDALTEPADPTEQAKA